MQASQVALVIKNPSANAGAWKIPGTGEPGGLLSMGMHRIGHDCGDLAAAAAAYI